jgi:methionine sulfoxide reductase heme-binding subunit
VVLTRVPSHATPRRQRFAATVATLHVSVHGGAALALGWLIWPLLDGRLGGDPVEALMRFLGKGALHLLLLTLLVTPMARALGIGGLNRLRRPLGLWCFAWATLHFAVWLSLDLQFHWSQIAAEIAKRNFLLVGFAAWFVLLALAITSLPRLMRAMGRRWKQLHRGIYVVALLAPLHYLWAVKSGIIEPALYLAVALALLWPRRHVVVPGRSPIPS